MTNAIVLALIKQLAAWLVGADAFRAAVGAVQRWENKQIAGVQKRDGVIDELQILGYRIAGRTANFLVEIALQYVARLK